MILIPRRSFKPSNSTSAILQTSTMSSQLSEPLPAYQIFNPHPPLTYTLANFPPAIIATFVYQQNLQDLDHSTVKVLPYHHITVRNMYNDKETAEFMDLFTLSRRILYHQTHTQLLWGWSSSNPSRYQFPKTVPRIRRRDREPATFERTLKRT